MEAELKAYEDSIVAVGQAVSHMQDCRKALHQAVEAASDATGKKVAEDTAAQPPLPLPASQPAEVSQ